MWKEQLQTSKNKLDMNIKDIPEEEESGPCNKKLEEYAENIRSATRLLTHEYKEIVESHYEPVPEDVACKALELLRNTNWTYHTAGDSRKPGFKMHHNIGNYQIWTYLWYNEYQIRMVIFILQKPFEGASNNNIHLGRVFRKKDLSEKWTDIRMDQLQSIIDWR